MICDMETRFVILLAFLSAVYAQQRWYYTGNFQNHDITTQRFAGVTFAQADLLDLDRHKHLIYGGLVSRAQASDTSDSAALVEVLQSELLAFGNDSAIHIVDSVEYPLHIAKNYGRYTDPSSGNETADFEVLKYKGEVGLYDHQKRIFLEKYWRDITIGELQVVKFVKSTTSGAEQRETSPVAEVGGSSQVLEVDISAAGDVVVSQGTESTVDAAIIDLTSREANPPSSTGAESPNPSAGTANELEGEIHQVAFTSDLHGRSTLYSHTWSAGQEVAKQSAAPDSTEGTTVKDVRVMSYNLWHNNPPSWVYHHPRYVSYLHGCVFSTVAADFYTSFSPAESVGNATTAV
jgi:hypothetical protein